jgi:hypothetical protein
MNRRGWTVWTFAWMDVQCYPPTWHCLSEVPVSSRFNTLEYLKKYRLPNGV